MNDETIKITIPLAPITKKNSQQIYFNSKLKNGFYKPKFAGAGLSKFIYVGVPFVAPSEKFKQYERRAGVFLKGYKIPFNQTPVNVQCLFYMPTRRRVDLTNLLEAIDDILTNYGVIEDDDAAHIGGHDGSRVYYDKENPRTEIIIRPLDFGVG